MAAEHATKIYTVAISGIVIIVAFLALTSVGHVIDAATQHFMLFYAGVLALIALCTSVGLGLVATDRMVLNPGHRVFVQAAHRAASFGAVTFLIIHIATEILAQRSHLLDAVVPFLSPFRPFYIGLGTIASDLIVLLVITGILRGRFTANGKAWRWRAIHYTSYVAFVFGVWHGLLGGRPGKPYVDWSYGFVVAFVAVGLAVRVLANSLRPKENLSSPPVDIAATSASAPLRAAAMFATARNTRGGRLGMTTGAQPMLSAPVAADAGPRVLTALPAGAGAPDDGRQPFYEPGYEGPPRYLGAPSHAATGPMPRADSGPMPRPATGPMPAAGTGSMPRAGTGPMPQAGGRPPAPGWGMPGPGPATGPLPRTPTGPVPRAATGSMPRVPTGPQQRPPTGPVPRAATGSMPGVPTGPQQRPPTGPVPRAATGSMPRVPTGPQQRPPTGPMPQGGGPMPPARGPVPQAGGPTPPYGYGAQPPVGRGGNWDYDQPPWDGGAPEPDPGFRYREPGPGMPGYRGPQEQYWNGPLEQHWGDESR